VVSVTKKKKKKKTPATAKSGGRGKENSPGSRLGEDRMNRGNSFKRAHRSKKRHLGMVYCPRSPHSKKRRAPKRLECQGEHPNLLEEAGKGGTSVKRLSSTSTETPAGGSRTRGISQKGNLSKRTAHLKETPRWGEKKGGFPRDVRKERCLMRVKGVVEQGNQWGFAQEERVT